MSDVGRKIRKLVKELERESAAANEFREWTKTDGGRINEFGADLIALAAEHEVPQAVIARVLNVTPAAISRRYKG